LEQRLMEIDPHVSLCVLKLFILHITLALLVENCTR